MIQIIFVPGTFGSTVEQFIRCFTENPSLESFKIADDGSTHIYSLPHHFTDKQDLDKFLQNYNTFNSDEIVSSIYPMANFCTDAIINFFRNEQFFSDTKVLINIKSIEDGEMILLFQYYKMANGKIQKQTNSMFLQDLKNHLDKLNENYKTVDDVPPWAVREWFSLYYPEFISTWINVKISTPGCLTIDYKNILNDTANTIKKIFKYCNKKLINEIEFNSAVSQWQNKQQYIINEFILLEKIVESTVNNTPFEWDKLHIIAEAIIQSRLRTVGYEIKCFELNEFPTDSLILNGLLEKLQ